MNRLVRRLAISAVLGLALTLASLGYSQATFYPVMGTSAQVQPVGGWGARGYPLPYFVQYCSCCLAPLSSTYPACTTTDFVVANAFVDYAFWLALAFLVVSLFEALWPALATRSKAHITSLPQ